MKTDNKWLPNRMVHRAVFGAFMVCGMLLFATDSQAQVVYSLGVQEVYDDNIFLENNTGTPPPFVLDDQLISGEPLPTAPIQADGDPDSDYITNLYFGASGAVPVSEHLKTSAEGKVGALLFADETDENRITVDGLIVAKTKNTLIPDPFYLSLSSGLESRANSVTAAEGTATRQAETMVSDFVAGFEQYQIAKNTTLAASYTLAYDDFLGNFTFGDDDNEADEFDSRYHERGSDYITNSLDSSLTHDLNNQLSDVFYLGVTDYVFTKVQSNDLEEKDESDLDRIEGRTGIGLKYHPSDTIEATANVGMNLNHQKHEPADQVVEIIGEDGSSTIVTEELDQDTVELTYGASISYLPEKASSIRLAAEQGVNTDIDGDRVISRSVTLDAAKAVGDRLKLAGGGKYFQFNIGDGLDNPTDRYEFTLSVSYNLTESLAIVGGWNYANQMADEDSVEQLFSGSEDYEVNRFFVGLTGGLVGLKS